MKKRWIPLLVIALAFLSQANAQINLAPKGKKLDAQQREQIQIDEQLAAQYFSEREYDKALDVYKKLYDKTSQLSHFHFYVECLIQLKDYGKAEKELKSHLKKTPTQYKSLADLIYVYTLEGKTDKARKRLADELNGMPANANSVRNLSSMLQARGLHDLSIAVLEKGNQLLEGKETFYLDIGYAHQSMVNYQEAFRYYLIDLKEHPAHYNNVRNRLQTLLFYDVNNSIADELRIVLLGFTQQNPDNIELAQLLVWFALQQEDYDIALAQCQSIDRRTHDQDAQINNLSSICLNNKQFDVAKGGYSYIVDKGKSGPFYGQAIVGIINADYQKLKASRSADKKAYNRLSLSIKDAYDDVNTSDMAKLLVMQADIMAYQLNQDKEAIALLNDNIRMVTSRLEQAELKLKLADLYLSNDEIWEATLLYSQVDKGLKEEPLGHEARFKNAQLRYFIGEYEWAESQLNVLKAATSKLIANDAMTLSLAIKDNLDIDTTGFELKRLAHADFRIYQQREDEAFSLLDEIIATGNEASIPHALFRKGELQAQQGAFVEAEQLFLQIVEQHPYSYMADAALMQAALIEQNELKNKESAAKHYEKLIDEYPTSIYTAQAKKNYRKL